MTQNTLIVMLAMVVYLVGMVVIGFAFSSKNKSSEDFYLGGRQLGPVVTAMSAEASDMSSWLLMGLPSVALLTGLPEAFWTALGLGVGTYINWLVIAKRIRRYSQEVDAMTIPGYFSKRYHDDSNILSLIASIAIIVFFVPYVASGFNAAGTLFATLFGVDYFPAMIISAIVIVAYTTLGGFLAASTTDLIQSVVMSIALMIIVFFGINMAGGWDNVVANAESLNGYLDVFKGYNPETQSAGSYGFITIISTLAWGLGYFGMPHILLRFMAIEDVNKLRISRRIATIWVIISMAVAVLIGIIGSGMIANGAIEQLDSSTAQRLIIKISELMSTHGVLPAILAGIILSGILAATMSTADSQLLAASSAVTEDILHDRFGVKLTEKKQMRIARITVFIIAIIAMFMAREERSVFTIVSFAWAGFGSTFGPTILLSLFWKRGNKWGALAGILSGGVAVFVWKYFIRTLGGGFDIYELLPAFIISIVINIVVSLLTTPPGKAVEAEFDRAIYGK